LRKECNGLPESVVTNIKTCRRKLVINIYLTYYVHLVGTKEVIDCKNEWSGKLKKNLLISLFFTFLLAPPGPVLAIIRLL